MSAAITYHWLGSQPYEPMWQRLKARAAAVALEEREEIIFCCEHEPVYTTGRRGVDNRTGVDLPAPLISTDRGGETTFHGRGQLMLYPVINLKQRHLSPRAYISLLEQSVINLLADMKITTKRQCGLPGVWSDDGKIAAIGLRIQSGVAYHGMALNVDVSPDWFTAINPCGTGKKSVSISRYITPIPELETVADRWHHCFHQLI